MWEGVYEHGVSVAQGKKLVEEVLDVRVDQDAEAQVGKTPRRAKVKRRSSLRVGKKDQEDAEMTKVLAYAALQKVGQNGWQSLKRFVAEAAWRDVLDKAAHPDVVAAAAAMLGKSPASTILAVVSKPGAEELMKGAVRTHVAAMNALGPVLLHVWAALRRPGILDETQEFESIEAEKIAVQQCEDRVVEVWKIIAEMAEHERDHVSGSAFQLLKTLFQEDSLEEFFSATETPFGPTLDKCNLLDRSMVLALRVSHHLTVRMELLFVRAVSFWSDPSLLSHSLRGCPTDFVFGSLSGMGNILDIHLSGTEVQQKDSGSRLSSASPHLHSAASTGKLLLRRSSSFEEEIDDFDTLENGSARTISAESSFLPFGGAGEYAAYAQSSSYAECACLVVTWALKNLLDPGSPASNFPNRLSRKIAGSELSRMSVRTGVSVETIPGNRESGYHQVLVIELVQVWAERFLLPRIEASANVHATLVACKCALLLCKATANHYSILDWQRKLLQRIPKSLLRNLLFIRRNSSKRDSVDLAKVSFYHDNLQLVSQAAGAEMTSTFRLDPIESAYFLSSGLIETASCPFAGMNYSKEDPNVLQVGSKVSQLSFSQTLSSLWRELFSLGIPAQELWTILSREDPGILQEILKNKLDSREIRFALCFSLLNSLRFSFAANHHSHADQTQWAWKALLTLEFTNICLTWEESSNVFDVATSYTELVHQLVESVKHILHSEGRNPDQELIVRTKSLLQRLTWSNLSFGSVAGDVRVKLLWILSSSTSLLDEQDVDHLFSILQEEVEYQVTQYSLKRSVEDLSALFECMMALSVSRRETLIPLFQTFLETVGNTLPRIPGHSALSMLIAIHQQSVGAIINNQNLPSPAFKRLVSPFRTLVTAEVLHLNRDHLLLLTGIRTRKGQPFPSVYRTKISGIADPVIVEVALRSDPNTGLLSLSLWAENRVSQCTLHNVQFVIESTGPLVVPSRFSLLSSAGSNKSVHCVQHCVPLTILSFDNQQYGFGFREEEDKLDMLDDFTAAMVSSIELAKKKGGSGRSIKAILRKSSNLSSSTKSLPNVVGANSSDSTTPKKRNSLTRRTVKSIRRRSLIASRGRFLRSASASSGQSLLAVDSDQTPQSPTGQDGDLTDFQIEPPGEDLLKSTTVALDMENPANEDYAHLGEAIDIAPRWLSVSILLHDMKIPFPSLELPVSLFLQPVHTASEDSSRLDSTYDRPNGWMDQHIFQYCWDSLKLSYFATASHEGKSCTSALLDLELCLGQSTRAYIPHQLGNQMCQAAWICSTLSGNILAFHVHLQEQHVAKTQITHSKWEIKTGASGIWKSWTLRPETFQSFFQSLVSSRKLGISLVDHSDGSLL